MTGLRHPISSGGTIPVLWKTSEIAVIRIEGLKGPVGIAKIYLRASVRSSYPRAFGFTVSELYFSNPTWLAVSEQ